MGKVTQTALVESKQAIWDYDPQAEESIVNGGLDVIAVIRTLAVKVRKSILVVLPRRCTAQVLVPSMALDPGMLPPAARVPLLGLHPIYLISTALARHSLYASRPDASLACVPHVTHCCRRYLCLVLRSCSAVHTILHLGSYCLAVCTHRSFADSSFPATQGVLLQAAARGEHQDTTHHSIAYQHAMGQLVGNDAARV